MELQRSTDDQNDQVHQSLRAYNRQYMRDFHDFSYHIEKDGQMVAGIVAGSTFKTVEVEFLYVDEAFRGQGLGSALLHKVEQEAEAAGMEHVLLNTYSFQAPGFYRKMGYTQLFEINPCLGPYAQHFFWKDLRTFD